MAGEPSFVCLFCIQARAYEFWFSLPRDRSLFILVNDREVAARQSWRESTANSITGVYLSTVRLLVVRLLEAEGNEARFVLHPFPLSTLSPLMVLLSGRQESSAPIC